MSSHNGDWEPNNGSYLLDPYIALETVLSAFYPVCHLIPIAIL